MNAQDFIGPWPIDIPISIKKYSKPEVFTQYSDYNKCVQHGYGYMYKIIAIDKLQPGYNTLSFLSDFYS